MLDLDVRHKSESYTTEVVDSIWLMAAYDTKRMLVRSWPNAKLRYGIRVHQ